MIYLLTIIPMCLNPTVGDNLPLWALQLNNFQSKLLTGSSSGVKTIKIILELCSPTV